MYSQRDYAEHGKQGLAWSSDGEVEKQIDTLSGSGEQVDTDIGGEATSAMNMNVQKHAAALLGNAVKTHWRCYHCWTKLDCENSICRYCKGWTVSLRCCQK
jgi:hypothetical protein